MLDKHHDLSRSGTGRSILKHPEPSVTRTNTSELREYNPATFSAQLRERLEPKAGEVSPYSQYSDLVTSPFSPFKDHSGYFSPNQRSPTNGRTGLSGTVSPNVPFSPYADSPVTPVGSHGTDKLGIGIAK